MGNPAGVKRNFDALERRRLEAARLLSRGWRPSRVALKLGVTRQSVNPPPGEAARASGLEEGGASGPKAAMDRKRPEPD
ncbi:MAG: helix-turn-helix domain-containing protein [Terriglobia bacterium]